MRKSCVALGAGGYGVKGSWRSAFVTDLWSECHLRHAHGHWTTSVVVGAHAQPYDADDDNQNGNEGDDSADDPDD